MAFGPRCAKHATEKLQQPALSKPMPASIRKRWSREGVHEKSLSDRVGRNMPPKSCCNRPHQNRCRPIFAKTGRGKGPKKKLSGPIGPKPVPRQPRLPGLKVPKRVLWGVPVFRRFPPLKPPGRSTSHGAEVLHPQEVLQAGLKYFTPASTYHFKV